MNYDYLEYWIKTMETKRLLEQLIQENLNMYKWTQDILYMEHIITNLEEIIRLKQLSEEIYDKIYFTLQYIYLNLWWTYDEIRTPKNLTLFLNIIS